jgi:hypothetical protein
MGDLHNNVGSKVAVHNMSRQGFFYGEIILAVVTRAGTA